MEWQRLEQVGAEALAEIEASQVAAGMSRDDVRRRQTVRRLVRELIDAQLIRPAAGLELRKVAEDLELRLPEEESGWRQWLAVEVFGQ